MADLSVSRIGNRLQASLAGTPPIDAFVECIRQMGELDADRTVTEVLIDYTGIGPISYGIEDVHRYTRAVRLHFNRGPEVRVGAAVSDGFMTGFGVAYLQGRSLFGGRSEEQMPRMEFFDDTDSAEAWLDGGN